MYPLSLWGKDYHSMLDFLGRCILPLEKQVSGCAMKNSNQICVGLLPINIISYALFFNIILEEFEDTKEVIRIRKSKTN
jgi:hypothetical protein